MQPLKVLQDPGTYRQLDLKAAALEDGITRAAARAGTAMRVLRIASLLTVFFSPGEVTDYESASRADTSLFARFFRQLLDGGIYWPPSQFEAAFISLSHSDEDIRLTVEVVGRAFQGL